MKKLCLVALMALMGLQTSAQNVSVNKALFKQGDDMSWAKPEMDDASWSEIDVLPERQVDWRDRSYADQCGWLFPGQ